MNLLLLYASDRRGDRFVIDGDRARHVREVLGASVGDTIRVGVLEGPRGTAKITSMGPEIELECAFEAVVPSRPSLDVILAIPRPKVLKRLLPELAALGVDRLVLLRTWRVDPSYLDSAILEAEHYRPHLHEGLMQARDTREPEVFVERRFRPFIEDRLATLFPVGVRVVAHPTATRTVAELVFGTHEKVILAIGPEGGFIPYEIDAFEGSGFLVASLGARTLRVETAVIALVAQVDLLRRLV